ncbi:MAG: hypothetical protein AABY49_06980 [Planctomycetota bacterium]
MNKAREAATAEVNSRIKVHTKNIENRKKGTVKSSPGFCRDIEVYANEYRVDEKIIIEGIKGIYNALIKTGNYSIAARIAKEHEID